MVYNYTGDEDFDGPIGDGPQGTMMTRYGLIYGFDPAQKAHVVTVHEKGNNLLDSLLGGGLSTPTGRLKQRQPVLQGVKRGEEMSEMTLEERIEELTRTLADLQRKKRLRDELKELHNLPDGGIVQFNQKFPRSEDVYNYVAIKTDDLWAISGNADTTKVGSSTDRFIAWLDHASLVVVLNPYVKTLRNLERSEVEPQAADSNS